MSNTKVSYLTWGLCIAGYLVGGLCLGVSLFQAAGLIIKYVQDPIMKWVIVAGLGAALLTSQVLVRSLVPLLKTNKTIERLVGLVVLVVTVGVIETMSVGSSSITFDGGLIEARRTQNINSPERAQLEKDVVRLEKRLERKESHSSKLWDQLLATATDQRTNRGKIQETIDSVDKEIRGLEYSITKKNKDINSVDVSTSGKAFDNMENKTGFSQTDFGILFGLLMTLCPISIMFIFGILSAAGISIRPQTTGGTQTTKKGQRQPLKVVA